jgi:hypothetical protein
VTQHKEFEEQLRKNKIHQCKEKISKLGLNLKLQKKFCDQLDLLPINEIDGFIKKLRKSAKSLKRSQTHTVDNSNVTNSHEASPTQIKTEPDFPNETAPITAQQSASKQAKN